MLPSGKQTLIARRAHWARNYMSQAGLVQAIRRGHYELTEEGRRLLESNPALIDNRTLKQFAPFREWMDRSRNTDTSKPDPASGVPDDDGATPEDSMAAASNALDAALVDDLLVLRREMNPVRFERLILDLLGAMEVRRRRSDQHDDDHGVQRWRD
jgi:restriction system protein